jgi:formamidopyrimidine-DNA glycosylase
MPELPEVETIKLELNRLIRGKEIKSVEINLAKQVKTPRARFLKLVQGRKIKGVSRRAKILIFELENGYYLVFHLKLTGQLIYRQKNKLAGGGHPIKQDLKDLPNKYSHVIFDFVDGSRLFFNDTRQFGWVKLVDKKELDKIQLEFGPEPLEISFGQFRDLFKSKKSVIKPLLMEQKFLAGVGNIYAQEALFCAGILPTRAADKINQKELEKLYNCLQKILKQAVAKKGTSADNYVDAFGREGSMEPYLKVYGRAGQKCKRCGSVLKLIKQGQRSTVYCPKCQK